MTETMRAMSEEEVRRWADMFLKECGWLREAVESGDSGRIDGCLEWLRYDVGLFKSRLKSPAGWFARGHSLDPQRLELWDAATNQPVAYGYIRRV